MTGKSHRHFILGGLLLAGIVFSVVTIATATAPDPGHNFTESSGGVVQGDLLYGSAADTLLALPKNTTATRFLSNTGTSNNPAWAQVTLTTGVTGILPVANGGTGTATGSITGTGALTFAAAGTNQNVTLTPSGTGYTLLNGNVGIGDATPVSLLTVGSGDLFQVDSSGNLIKINNTTYSWPAAQGAAGTTLTNNGSGTLAWTGAMTTAVTRPALATGANSTQAMSLTTYYVGLFNLPYSMTVNQLTYNISTANPSGTMRVCVYTEDGASKLIDVTNTITTSINSVSVGGVVLTRGNYYIAVGLASSGTAAMATFNSTAMSWINKENVPAGKKVYEGTVTMTSGTCNSTLPTITGAISSTGMIRLDN